MTIEQMAARAYNAYGATTDHKNYQSLPMPKWEELPEKIQQAWIAAARAVQVEDPNPSADSDLESRLRTVLDCLITAIKALKDAEAARDAAALVRAAQDAQRYQKALRDGLDHLRPYREDLFKTVSLYLSQKEELEKTEAKFFPPANIFS